MSTLPTEFVVYSDEREELRLSITEFKGKPYVHLRVWGFSTTSKAPGKRYPTRHGMTIRPSQVAALIAALEKVSGLVKSGMGR